MKKQMKKVLALLLALVMCMGVFAGCSGDTTGDGDDVVTAPTIPTVNQNHKNSEIYPLDSNRTFNFTVVNTKDVNEFYSTQLWEELTGVEIDYSALASEGFKLAVTTGDFGDAVFYSGGIEKNKWNEMGMDGRFVNFMDYIEYMPNFSRALQKYPEVLPAVMAPDGGVYSLPRIGTTATTHDALFVRTDHLKQAGWDEMPATVDEFKQCLKDLQKTLGANNPDYHALSPYSKAMMDWDSLTGLPHFLFPSFGDLMETGYTVDENGKIVFGASTEQFKRLLVFLNEIVESDYCEFGADVYSEDGVNSQASMLGGNATFCPQGTFMTTKQFPSGKFDMTLLRPLTSQWQDEIRFDAKDEVYWQCNGINAYLPEDEIITLVQWFDSFYAFQDNPLNEEGTAWGISFWIGLQDTDFVLDEENKSYTILDHADYETSSLWLAGETFSGSLGLFGTDSWMYVQKSNSK